MESDRASVDEELRKLRAERDALAAELAAAREERPRTRSRAGGGRFRHVVVGALVALFAVLLPLAVTTAWVHRTVLNTDTYVKTVTPIAANRTVTASVSRQLTDQIYNALDPQALIADALPPRAAFLAGPIAGGVKSFVQDQVNNLLNSPQFQQFWVQANREAHSQLLDVLNGKSNTIVTSNGQVVLNLVPVFNTVLQSLQGTVSELVGRNVKLPTLSGNELPAVACEKISAALNRPVPTTCGQVPLFPEDRLTNAQRAVRAFNRLLVAMLVLLPLLLIAALWISRRRRRTLIQLTVGGLLGLVIVRRAVMWFQDQLIATAAPENTASRTIVVHHLLHNFFVLTQWFLVGGLVVLVVALLTGPYRWARALRNGVRRVARAIAGAVVAAAKAGAGGVRTGVAKARDDRTIDWIQSHLDALRIAGVVVVIVLILVLDLSFIGFLVIAALLVAYEFWLYRLKPAQPEAVPPAGTTTEAGLEESDPERAEADLPSQRVVETTRTGGH
jgi:hypothetical protein